MAVPHMRQFSLVTLTDETLKNFKNLNREHMLHDELPLIYLGEIPNMGGHGVFISYNNGKIFSGYHIADFRELTETEW